MSNTIGSTDFRMQHFTIRELMDYIDSGRMLLNRLPDKKWGVLQSRCFIESVLCGIPVASIYINGSRPQWTVLDGVERLYAIKSYVENDCILEDLEILPNTYDGYFSELPLPIRRRFLNTPIYGYVLTTELSPRMMNSIFKRLNQLKK